VIRWTGTFPYAVKNVLRDSEGLGPIASGLPWAELKWVLNSDHPPLSIATRITPRLVKARDKGLISDFILGSLDQNVQQLVDYLGACERIHTTPIPFAYMVHLRRVLILYCLTLPFALIDSFGWITVPAMLGVAHTLLGIKEIGAEIEDPFGNDLNDLALEDLCGKVAKNLLALTGHHGQKDMQHNRGSTLSRDVRRGSRPAAREQEKKIANAIQADESKAQRCCCADSASPDLWARSAKSSRKPERFHAASDLKIGDSAMDQNRNSESDHRAGHLERLTTYRTFRRSAISSNFAWLAANPFT
jgi:hypothetical protein